MTDRGVQQVQLMLDAELLKLRPGGGIELCALGAYDKTKARRSFLRAFVLYLLVGKLLERQVVIASRGWCAGGWGRLWRGSWLLHGLLILLHGLLVTLLRVTALRLECALRLQLLGYINFPCHRFVDL